MIWIKKIFDLSDIRYSWMLLVSMVLFLAALYNNKVNPDMGVNIEFLTYGTAIGCAFLWSIFNYVDHIKINAIYKKGDNIDAYVNSLVMNKSEKEDLRQYLYDFVKDLEASGKTTNEAVRTAIGQFQVNEFTSLTKNTGIFELPGHSYLIGYAVIFALGILLSLVMINTGLAAGFWINAVNFMLILYFVSFLSLLLLYKIIDNIFAKKLTH